MCPFALRRKHSTSSSPSREMSCKPWHVMSVTHHDKDVVFMRFGRMRMESDPSQVFGVGYIHWDNRSHTVRVDSSGSPAHMPLHEVQTIVGSLVS